MHFKFEIRNIRLKNMYNLGVEYTLMLLLCLAASVVLSSTLWRNDIPLLHTSSELICIFIALLSFLIVFLTYRNNLLFNRLIGYCFLPLAFFDALHTYYCHSLGLYTGNYSDISLKFWLLGRLTEAIILILITFRLSKIRVNKWIALLLTITVSLVMSLPIISYPGLLSDLTSTGIFMEYMITLLFMFSLLFMKESLDTTDFLTYKYIFMSILLAIPAELCFAIFNNVTLFYSILGHVLKIICYAYLFKGIFRSVVIHPYEMLEKTKVRLEDSKNELNEILNSLSTAIINCDENGRISFINKAACDLLECKPCNILDITFEEMIKKFSPENRNVIGDMKGKSFHAFNGVGNFITLNGNKIKLNFDMVKYKNGILASFSNTKKDQELNDIKIQTILDSIYNLVFITDTNLNIVLFNKAFTDCLEMEYRQIMGMDVNALIRTTNFSLNGLKLDMYENGIEFGKSIEASLVTPKGNMKDLLFHLGEILGLDGEVLGYIGVASDITGMKSEQQKIMNQEKLAIIGQMGSGIVHETKNHLASIKGYCQLLSMKVNDEQLKGYINRIENITADVNNVIVDFLSMVKPSENVTDITSLNEIIKSMHYMLESPSFVRGVKIEFNLSDCDMDIKANEAQIKQIILNMSKNAIEAMSEVENAKLKISTKLNYNGSEVLLIISDNGKGISKENLEKLGTPFFTTKDTGTGLGLNVCYRIAKEHGGKIEVMSEQSKGTTFIISFPCYKETA